MSRGFWTATAVAVVPITMTTVASVPWASCLLHPAFAIISSTGAIPVLTELDRMCLLRVRGESLMELG